MKNKNTCTHTHMYTWYTSTTAIRQRQQQHHRFNSSFGRILVQRERGRQVIPCLFAWWISNVSRLVVLFFSKNISLLNTHMQRAYVCTVSVCVRCAFVLCDSYERRIFRHERCWRMPLQKHHSSSCSAISTEIHIIQSSSCLSLFIFVHSVELVFFSLF